VDALIGALWFGERCGRRSGLGLAIGALGVVVLVGDKVGLNPRGAAGTRRSPSARRCSA